MFKDTTILAKSLCAWDHVNGESIEIAHRSNIVNRDTGLQLGKIWKPALWLLTSR